MFENGLTKSAIALNGHTLAHRGAIDPGFSQLPADDLRQNPFQAHVHILVFEFLTQHVPQNLWKVHGSHFNSVECFY